MAIAHYVPYVVDFSKQSRGSRGLMQMAYVVLGWMGQPFMLPHFFKGLFLKLFIYYAQIVFGVLFKLTKDTINKYELT